MDGPSNPIERLPNPALKAIDPPNPTTTRGAPAILNVHPKENKLIYCSGKLVIVRHLDHWCSTEPAEVLDEPSNFDLVYKGHQALTTAAVFSPNGFWVASGDSSGKVRVWSYDHPEHPLKKEIQALAGPISDLCWDAESKRIVAVGQGRGMLAKAFMWDTGNSIGEFVGHQKSILSVTMKPSRPLRVFSASEDTNVCMYAGPPFKFQQSLTDVHSNFVNSIRTSPNEQMVVSVGSDQRMNLYDATSGEVLAPEFEASHEGSIYSVCWNAESTEILTASSDKTVKRWDVASRRVLETFVFGSSLGDMQVAVAWKNEVMISLSLSGRINILSAGAGNTRPRAIIEGHQVSITALMTLPGEASSSPNNILVSGSYDGKIVTWSRHRGRALEGPGHSGKISSLSGATDVMTFASTGWDDTLRWATTTSDDFDMTSYHVESHAGVTGQPTGVAMIRASSGGSGEASAVTVVCTLKRIQVFRGHQMIIETTPEAWTPSSVDVTPSTTSTSSENDDGVFYTIAVGSEETNLYFYSLMIESSGGGGGNPSLELCHTCAGHRGPITCVEFSSNGKMLAAGDGYREVRVWDIPGGVAPPTVKISNLWVHHTTRITCLTWSPNDEHVASGSVDEHIYIWNVSTPMKRRKIEYTHKDGVTGLAFVSNELLVSAGQDGVICTWDLMRL